MKLRRHAQFVVELAVVRIAQQVNVKTVKVRSDIKHKCPSDLSSVSLIAYTDTLVYGLFFSGIFDR